MPLLEIGLGAVQELGIVRGIPYLNHTALFVEDIEIAVFVRLDRADHGGQTAAVGFLGFAAEFQKEVPFLAEFVDQSRSRHGKDTAVGQNGNVGIVSIAPVETVRIDIDPRHIQLFDGLLSVVLRDGKDHVGGRDVQRNDIRRRAEGHLGLLLLGVEDLLEPLHRAQALRLIRAEEAVEVPVSVELQNSLVGALTDDKQIAVAVQIHLLRLIGTCTVICLRRARQAALHAPVRCKDHDLLRAVIGDVYPARAVHTETGGLFQVVLSEGGQPARVHGIDNDAVVAGVRDVKLPPAKI